MASESSKITKEKPEGARGARKMKIPENEVSLSFKKHKDGLYWKHFCFLFFLNERPTYQKEVTRLGAFFSIPGKT